MLLYCPIGFADRTEAEVVGPANHHAIEAAYDCCLNQQGLVPSGFAADRLTDAGHPLLRWNSAQIGPPRFRRIATSKRIPQKVELLFRHPADPRLCLVYRQLQSAHDVPHRCKCIFCTPATADHQVISIIDDIRSETLLVSQLLPAEHEPAHVQIAE